VALLVAFTGLGMFFVAAALHALTLRARTELPLCSAHAGYFRKRKNCLIALEWGGLALGILLLIVALALLSGAQSKAAGFLVFMLASFIWFGSWSWRFAISRRGVRAVDLTPRTVTLADVPDSFADAVQQHRDDLNPFASFE
jgi:hypothetical protein